MKKFFVVLALIVGLAACETDPAGKVLIVGDSNAVLTAPEMITNAQMRNHGYEVQFEAIPGLGYGDAEWYWSKRLPKVLEDEDVDVVVITLGINDILRPTEALTNPAPYVDALLSAVGDREVIVVVPQNPQGSPLSTYLRNLDGVTVLDFLSSWSPSKFEGAHLNAAGRKQYAEIVVASIDQLLEKR